MSHNLYNPYSPESQDSSQGTYQPSAQVGPGNVGEPSHLVVPGSTHASYGASSRTSMNPSHIHQSMHTGSMGQGHSLQTTELENAIDIHIKQVREEVSLQSLLKKPVALGPAGYRTSMAVSQEPFSGYSNTMPSDGSNWPSSHHPNSREASYNVYSSTSPSAPNIPPSHYSQSSESYPVSHYSSGCRDNDVSSNKPSTTAAGSAPSAPRSRDNHPSSTRNPEYNQNKFTSESAMDILKRFNLQEEDLEELCGYSEDQLSSTNLPYLLRDIRQKKAKRSSSASQSSMAHQTHQRAPETTTGPGAKCDSAYQQQSTVIEYGHTSKYTGGFREKEEGRGHHSSGVRPSESALLDSYTTQSPETQQKDIAQSKYGVPMFSHGSQRSTTSSPVYSALQSMASSLRQSADHMASVASQRPVPGAITTNQKPGPGAGTTSQRPVPWVGTSNQRPIPAAGTTSQRPAPGTNPGAVPGPKSIPMNQLPPPVSDSSLQRPLPAKPSSKRTPTAAMISDYMGATPKSFPHTCCLCNKPCDGMKDWLNHKQHIVHRASCRLLCKQYSEWEPNTVTLNPAPEKSLPSLATSTASSSQSSRPSIQAISHGGPAPSNSSVDRKSRSPQRKRSRSKSSGRKQSKSSGRKRSRSPQRKRSRSKSSGRKHSKSSGRKQSKSSGRKRSRSKSSGSSPRRKWPTGRASSPCSSRDIRSRRSRTRSLSNSSSPHHHHGKTSYSPARRSRRTSGSPRRGQGSPSPRDTQNSRWWSPSSRQTRRSHSGSRSPHPPSQSRRSRSQSHDRSPGHRQEQTGVEELARKLLETSGVQTSTGPTSLEVVVQSLAPVLLAELAKRKSSSSSFSPQDQNNPPSSSSVGQKKPSPSSSARDKQTSSFFLSRDEQRSSSSLTKGWKQPPSSSQSSSVQVPVKKSLPTKFAKPPRMAMLGNRMTAPGNKMTIHTNLPISTIVSSRPTTMPPLAKPFPTTLPKPVERTQVRKWQMHNQVPPCLPTIPFLKSIECVDVRSWNLADFQSSMSSGATIMVTDLPEQIRCHYREPEMIRVLERFANVECDKYFILPDHCMAFVEMAANKMEQLVDVLTTGVRMNHGMIHCHLLKEDALRSPITFYQQLLKWSEKVYDEASLPYRLVYISNFPTNEDYWMDAFRDGITKTGGVRVYLPLMGKIFVEFDTVKDADRFGVWLSTFRPKPELENNVQVIRPGIIPDTEATTPGSTRTQSREPFLDWSEPPCWLPVPTLPFFYPTLCPQFYIPAHRTVRGPRDIEWAKVHLAEQSAVMVTGLPMGGYRHIDLLDEVWPYFLEKDVSHVFYHVVILPLQRRAFIYFDDDLKSLEFLSVHLTKPLTIGGCDLTLHFLLEHLRPCNTEMQLYNHLLHLSNVVPEEKPHKEFLMYTSIYYCSAKALKFLFYVMRKTPYISCVILANRAIFQTPRGTKLYDVIGKLMIENEKLVGERTVSFPKPNHFYSRQRYVGTHMHPDKFKKMFRSQYNAAQTVSGQSPCGPSAPGQSDAAITTSGPTPVAPAAPADPGRPAQDQAGPLSFGTQSPALSLEMSRFFAMAIQQHRQATGGPEVSRVGQEKENQQVSGELLKTSSSTTSRRVQSSFSTAAGSSTAAQWQPAPRPPLQIFPRLPSSSPSIRVVPSFSEQNTSQKKCEESPAQVSEAGATTYPTSASSQEVTHIPPTEEAESLPACQPITNEEPPREAATECEGGVARLGHKMAAEASALKSAESQTGKETLNTNPSLEEEGERKAIEAQQELTLSGQDMLIFPTEDTKKSRVEVDETNQQMGDGKIGDHMLHSGPDCGQETSPQTLVQPETPNQTLVQPETPHQTLVQSEMPTLPDPASQTPEPHEDKMLAKVAEEAEPVQEVPEDTETVLEEEKMTVVEEQRPSAHEETPTVVSDAAEIPPGTILNGTSTEVDDTHQLMDCVEASPPKEESNEEPTEEAQNSKDPTEETQNSKDPTEEAQNSKEPTEEAQNSKEPTEEAQNSKEPTAMEEANKKDEQGNKEEQSAKDFAGEKENIKEEQHSKELAEEKVAPDMEQRQSKRGHPSPAAKPPSTRRSTRSSTPAKKRESPAGNPVKVEVDEQILDSVEEGSSSTRGGGSPPSGLLMPQDQPNLEKDESDYQVVDSVECEVEEDEGVQISTRRPSTRGKRGRPPQQTAKNAREKKEQPMAPVPEKAREGPHDPVENQDSPTMTETQDQEATYRIIDSVGGEPNMEEPSKKGEEPRGKEGDAEKSEVADKWQESGQGVSLEEVATYQVLDSVGEELPLVTKATKGRGRKTGERRGGKATNPPTMKDNQLSLDETMFEVLDVAEESAEQPGRPRRGLAKKDPPPAREGKTSRHTTPEGAKQDQEEKEAHPSVGAQQTAAAKRRSGRRKNEEEVVVSGTSKIAAKEGQQMVQDLKEEVYQVVDSIENKPLEEKEEHGNSSGPRRRSSRRRDPAPAKTRATRTPDKATQGKETLYQVVDSVGEEQVPEEPVRGKRGRKVTRSDANTEEQASKKKKTKEQSTAPKGDEDGGGERETVLVSLDEVSDEEEDYPDDSVEEEELRRQAVAKEMRREEEEEERKVGAEMEGLVTLDEVGEEELGEEEQEEEEEQKEGEVEEEGGITEEELQALVTLDEIVEEEGELGAEMVCDQEESSSITAKPKQREEQAEEVSFVTVDEVGYEDQEETHLRRSTRGGEQQATPKLSGQQAPPTPLHAAPLLAGKPGAVLSDRGAESMAESPAQDGEERREGRKASSKVRREEEGAEPKRVCSLSPSIANDYTLPPFTPDNPLGMDNVVPKVGFYCNLCSVFYEDETTAKSLHCSSLSHYRNLERQHQRLKEEQSRSQSGASAPSHAPR